MLEIIEAPNTLKEDNNKIKLFLAGGITNCPNWQLDIINMLKDQTSYIQDNIIVFNPRRENFPIHDLTAAKDQITWEYKRLKESDIIVFWFSRGSLNPIVLYEYGKYGTSQPTEIVVGIDDEYERKQDVEIQTKLARPTQKICYGLDDFSNEIVESIYKMLDVKK